MTREQLETARARLASEHNFVLAADSGIVKQDLPIGHATVAFNFDGTCLTIQLMECPHLERGKVEAAITEWFK